jgi:hypothetical protein
MEKESILLFKEKKNSNNKLSYNISKILTLNKNEKKYLTNFIKFKIFNDYVIIHIIDNLFDAKIFSHFVIKNINNSYYYDLPVVYVKYWEDVNEYFLSKKYEEIVSKQWNYEKLNFNFWKNKIINYKNI